MKKVRNKIYLHKTSLDKLDTRDKSLVNEAIVLLPKNTIWNIIRLDNENKKIGFLDYPHFELDPHPALHHSTVIDLDSGKVKSVTPSAENPPILHRKETFLTFNDKNYETFSRLTQQEQKAGLLDPKISHRIGFKKYWEELMDKKGLTIINHQLKSKTQ